jgi:hypothetical protein
MLDISQLTDRMDEMTGRLAELEAMPRIVTVDAWAQREPARPGTKISRVEAYWKDHVEGLPADEVAVYLGGGLAAMAPQTPQRAPSGDNTLEIVNSIQLGVDDLIVHSERIDPRSGDGTTRHVILAELVLIRGMLTLLTRRLAARQ